ncbi:Aspartic proteinase-like protein 2 [Camellia lanceoleosa]|uniref:Aspartic proteinase-like protein 2 n=1 Tax=Camellia lanceoleosa TaxID=1840588 RepID=A0ACC0IAK0_9ERIC|nr:Aspartic proteinase-like protein 2 [Camellia lanceoleosa]
MLYLSVGVGVGGVQCTVSEGFFQQARGSSWRCAQGSGLSKACPNLVRVKLDSPPKEFSVQINTGSDILWATYNSCNDGPQSSGHGIEFNFFDAVSLTTASLVSCSDPILCL